MALDYTYCEDAGYPRPHRSSLASFDQDDGFGNLIDTWHLLSRAEATRFSVTALTSTFLAGTDHEY